MALRRGSRVIFLSPAKLSLERRGRDRMRAPGSSSCTARCMVPAPISRVSARPR